MSNERISQSAKLILIWENADPPPDIPCTSRYIEDIVSYGQSHPLLYMIGTDQLEPSYHPLLWIGSQFGEPTGPAGDPWPLPIDACAPPKAAERFSNLRVRPEQCDAFWLSYFLPDWRDVDQDRDQILVRLSLAWSEAMTLSAIVDEASRNAVKGATWIIRWRFHTWWSRGSNDLRQSQILSRAQNFLNFLSERAIIATGCRQVYVMDAYPQIGTTVRTWKMNETLLRSSKDTF